MGKIMVCAGIAVFAAALLAAGGGKVEWGTDYDAGLKKAKEEGKAILLDFGGPW